MSENKAPSPSLINLFIDGKPVSVSPGTTVIKAAETAGTFIPHFCYHPGLSVVGQCRMCFVEIEGAPKLATSCSTTVAEGMKVLTQSEKVKAGQKGTLEFTLLNHPLDCPICDRGGECLLQDFTYEYGPSLSRMLEEKAISNKHMPVSENVYLDQERCILCTRCVRFSSEVDGRNELVVNARGHLNYIDVFEGRPMESAFSGNVVDLCPVGALTAKDYRFKARPWELKKHEAICSGCSQGCNIEIHTKHRDPKIPRPEEKNPLPKIERLVPRENADVNQWWLCDKGRWGYSFHNELPRIFSPQLKRQKQSPSESVSLREIQAQMDAISAKNQEWEFWISDNLPYEGIRWAKSLAQSWTERGRKVAPLNFVKETPRILEIWKQHTGRPWGLTAPHWDSIQTIVAPYECRDLEKIVPILALRLGQKLRQQKLQWKVLSPEKMLESHKASPDTAYLFSAPKSLKEWEVLAQFPMESNVLVLFTQANSRGLLNEGIVPMECLEDCLGTQKTKHALFYFGQMTQNPLSKKFTQYALSTEHLVVADAFESELSRSAEVCLPITPLYESPSTLSNLENLQQHSKGIWVDHPNKVVIHRGGELISPSLKLI